MKKAVCIFLVILLMSIMSVQALAVEENKPFDVNAKSAVLMEASTGSVIYAKNPNEPLPPASVTKIMTLLLTMEAVDSGALKLTDTISVSEYAASMGGSQVFLEPFEEMPLEDMLKSIVISSANDAAVAVAEKVAGSEEAFVSKMNERAKALNMTSTNFENVTGLDDDTKNHNTSAYDIALMSRELIVKHPTILNYSSIWMDSIRGGKFGLTNTNRLVRFYKGATGLKTGSTSKAGFCISATAKRDGMHLISVIMGSETRDKRNAAAQSLLDWGFANYNVVHKDKKQMENIKVIGGVTEYCRCESSECDILAEKSKGKISEKIYIKDEVKAPVKKGDTVGKIKYYAGKEKICEVNIVSLDDVKKITYGGVLTKILKEFLLFS